MKTTAQQLDRADEQQDDAEGEVTTPALPSSAALTALALAVLLPSLGTSSANVALPTLARSFGTTFQGAQWVVLAYLLTTTALIVGVGRLGDLSGRRRLLTAGIALFTAASLLCGSASAIWQLLAARAVQGLGAAIMMALALAFVGELVPKARIGSAMGLLGLMSAVGTALGPSLGGGLIALCGWRAIFLVNVPVGVLAAVLAHRFLPPDCVAPKAVSGSFDLAGMLLLALTLTLYALAMTAGRGRIETSNVVLLLLAVFGAALFVRAEARAADPLLRFSLFRGAKLRVNLALSTVVSTILMSTLVVGPFYLSVALKLDAGLTGTVMSVGPLVAALSGVPAGRLVDRRGAQQISSLGLAGIAAGALLLSIVPESAGIPGYLAPIAVITACYALFQAANNTAVMRDVAAEQRGITSALLNLSRSLGLITGSAVMGALFAFVVGSPDITQAPPDAVAAGMRTTFRAAGLVMLAAVALARQEQ